MSVLPVVVDDCDLPRDDTGYKDIVFEDDDFLSSSRGGFVSGLFLVGVIAVSFMWGMLVIVLGYGRLG